MLWQLATHSKLYPILMEHCGSTTARALFDLSCLGLLDPERFAALMRALGQGAEFAGCFCSYLTGQRYDLAELKALLGALSSAAQHAVYRALTEQGRRYCEEKYDYIVRYFDLYVDVLGEKDIAELTRLLKKTADSEVLLRSETREK